MNRRIHTLTSSLTFLIILLAGCSGCGKTTTPEFKPPVETPQEGENPTTTTHQSSGALPTEFYPPENPYQDITINGEAPPFAFYGNPVYWVPHLEYEIAEDWRDNITFPVIPDIDLKAYITRIKALAEARGEPVSKEEQSDIRYQMKYGNLTPLDAAKVMLSEGLGASSQRLSEVAQQALDANPNDFHTLLIWTEAQPYRSESEERGYRQLLELRPNNAYVLLRLGLAINFEKRQESIQLFKKAVQYAPNIEYGTDSPSSPSVHVRDWALQELAEAYFWEGEKQKSTETFQYLQQITENKRTRKRATEYLKDIKEGYKFGIIGLPPQTTDEGNTPDE